VNTNSVPGYAPRHERWRAGGGRRRQPCSSTAGAGAPAEAQSLYAPENDHCDDIALIGGWAESGASEHEGGAPLGGGYVTIVSQQEHEMA
jgi:hypothetical protein